MMTWSNVILALAAFVFAAAEETVSLRRQKAYQEQNRARTVLWSGSFEILIAGYFILIKDATWLAIPVILGAMTGAYFSVPKQTSEPAIVPIREVPEAAVKGAPVVPKVRLESASLYSDGEFGFTPSRH